MNILTRPIKNIVHFINIKECRKALVAPNSIFFPVLWITNQRNLRCRMCDQWKMESKGELTTEEWCAFIDAASRMHAKVIVITGGEPLMRADVFDIIQHIREKGISCHLCSNGSLLDNPSVINKLKQSGLSSISVSLDSFSSEIYKNIRGVDCFDAAVEGIKLLKKIAPEIKVGINYLITRLNFVNLDQMVRFSAGLKVDQLKFDLVHTNLVHRSKSQLSFQGLLFTEDDLPKLKIEINKLIAALSRSRLLTNSRTFLNGILPACQKQQHKYKCYAGYISCAIDAFGKVSPCDNFDGQDSLRSKSFEEIWRSPAFAQLRQKVQDCNEHCWDSTHGEINLRCSLKGLLKEIPQVIREQFFYL